MLSFLTAAAVAWNSCEKNGPAEGGGPCVDRISPTTGSLVGGQLVFIYGTNLQPEAPDPLVPASVVTIGGTACDVQRVLSSGTRLACRTREYSGFPAADMEGVVHGTPRWHDRGCDSGKQAVSVLVKGVGGNIMGQWNAASRYCMRGNADRFCSFTWAWKSTPHIVSVAPRAAAPGEMVTVSGAICAGDFVNGDTGERTEPALKRFERVLVGDFICELSTPSCEHTPEARAAEASVRSIGTRAPQHGLPLAIRAEATAAPRSFTGAPPCLCALRVPPSQATPAPPSSAPPCTRPT